MKGDGGKFGQLGLANGEPREGSAPSPRPRPPRLPQRECVRLAHCAWRLGPRQAVRELQPPPPPPAAVIASSAAAEPGAGERARPRQPSPARPDSLPTPGQEQQAAAAAAGREGGGRNPARSTRAPSWTIMIPSKPTTTCSPKRTGIGTCSWTRPGRSSRERSAASPARRSPPARPAPPAALPAPGSERAPGSHERGRGMRGRCEVGCWVTGAGGRGRAPFPEPANAEPERGEVGPPAGRSPWGPRFWPPGCSRTVPAWAGGGRRCLGGWG